MTTRLDRFENGEFERGRSRLVETLWIMVGGLVLGGPIPGSSQRVAILRLFGATIGRGVVIKPGTRVKFPWRLTIGDHSWIGESVWIDNLAEVEIGAHVCVSQGAYLCAGSHDWRKSTFDLIVRPIRIESGSWVGAMASIAPGVIMRAESVLTMGSVATREIPPGMIAQGNPAEAMRERVDAADTKNNDEPRT